MGNKWRHQKYPIRSPYSDSSVFVWSFVENFPTKGTSLPPPPWDLPFWSVPQQVGPAELYAVISRTTFFLCTLYTTVHFKTNSHLFHNLSLSYLPIQNNPPPFSPSSLSLSLTLSHLSLNSITSCPPNLSSRPTARPSSTTTSLAPQ